MEIFKMIDRINVLHYLIQNERTGRPNMLAKHLGVSRGTLYNMIEELKSYDAPIEYSRIKQSFYYTRLFELDLKYTLKLIDDEMELKKVSGGCHLFPSVQIFRRKDDTFTFISQEC